MARLQDSESFVRAQAAAALGVLRVASQAICGALVGLLQDHSWLVRAEACRSLAALPPGSVSPGLLLPLMDDPSTNVILATTQALTSFLAAPGVFGCLVQQLGSDEVVLRVAAVRALQGIDPHLSHTSGQKAVRCLVPLLQDPCEEVREEASKALTLLCSVCEPETLLRSLLEGPIRDQSARVRRDVVDLVGGLISALPCLTVAVCQKLLPPEPGGAAPPPGPTPETAGTILGARNVAHRANHILTRACPLSHFLFQIYIFRSFC